MTPPRDHYEVLGVQRDASDDDIRKAYRRLAVKYHPDKNPGDDEAAERFKEVGAAYQCLSNADSRAYYDRHGHEGVRGSQGGFDFTTTDFTDLFSQVFGDFGDLFGGGSRTRRGNDIRYDVELTLEEAHAGKSIPVELERFDACGTCKGSGVKPGSTMKSCAQCGGRGRVVFQQGFFSVQQTCPRCQGRGEIMTDPCGECRGLGRVRGVQKLNVTIPRGVDDGMVLRMNGQGDAGRMGAPAGNLLVGVHVKAHPLFQRKGDDLLLDWRLTMVEAALGTRLRVPIIGGEEPIVIPEGTQTADTFTLRGKGMPHLQRNGSGDLKVRVFVETPTRLSDRDRELLREFAEQRQELDGDEADPKRGQKSDPYARRKHKRGFFEAVGDFFSGQDARSDDE
ncbi:molecular chaperone DnaJ [Candidatus Poribacteria bacterium]|nr:molecular chaperone DnaJ [Candidatus Poribacteria bacterium]